MRLGEFLIHLQILHRGHGLRGRCPISRDQLVHGGGIFAYILRYLVPFRVLVGRDFQRRVKVLDPLLDGDALCLGGSRGSRILWSSGLRQLDRRVSGGIGAEPRPVGWRASWRPSAPRLQPSARRARTWISGEWKMTW